MEDQENEITEIPGEHQEIADRLGWGIEEYAARIPVLEKDGVDLEQLALWKEQYGEVYRDQFLNHGFYYRSITRPEHNEEVMGQSLTYQQREEVVTSLCTLHPAAYDFKAGPAGITNRLMELILDHSGFITDGPTMSF